MLTNDAFSEIALHDVLEMSRNPSMRLSRDCLSFVVCHVASMGF